MIVDSSALVAMLTNEEDGEALSVVMDGPEVVRMSAASYLETSIVIDAHRDAVLSSRLDDMILDSEIVIEPVTPEQARIARQAYRDYGRGSGHRANLNFGDCFSYALARVKREPILFKGEDFGHTDLRSALKA
ncbi:MAG TPA: type II toxin-antitoxin system VapC family toxin [Terracidiphilus sp.]|jgi:ribonuclease VapC|nr:type II toxin-antitoxin system VapC family toxin [Terracidiphilus sp.]